MRTDKIHGYANHRIRLKMPVLKRVNNHYVFSGTLYAPVANGEILPFSLTRRWLSLDIHQVDMIIGAMTSDNTESVWVHDRPGLEYPAKLVKLPLEVAKPLGLHYQQRYDPRTGELAGRYEVCVADEILAHRYLSMFDITPRDHPLAIPVETCTIEDALVSIRASGGLPHRLDPVEDPELANIQ